MSHQTPAATEADRPARPRVLSGIQPTGDSFHFGNYLGALRQWVDLQDEYEPFFFIADLHSLTVEQDPKVLRQRFGVRRAADRDGHRPRALGDLPAVHVPEHTQLAWVLQCITGFGEARRMTQFKDKSAKGGESAASRRPVRLPDPAGGRHPAVPPEVRPGGEDQRQHLELTRDLAQRFNHRYKKTFPLPEPYILKSTGRILDLQDPAAKMSKSASAPPGIIEMLDDPRSPRRRSARRSPTRRPRSASTRRTSPASPTCSRSTPR